MLPLQGAAQPLAVTRPVEKILEELTIDYDYQTRRYSKCVIEFPFLCPSTPTRETVAMIETRKSICRFCYVGCGVEADVDLDSNRIVALRGDGANPVSFGYTCVKGRAELERLYHPERLLSSKKLRDGALVDIDAEQALDEVAQKLRAIIDEHGPDAVAVHTGAGCTNMSTSGHWLWRKWMDAIGSNSFYTSYTIDCPSRTVAPHRFWGGIVPLEMFDMEHADVAMFVGTNPLVSHTNSMPQPAPRKLMRKTRARGMKVIVIDPRRCETALCADLHLQVKPGEDATLLAAMIKVILERKLYDHDYVARYASGLEALSVAVGDFDLAYAARRTGVPASHIESAALMFATAKRGAATQGVGVTLSRHPNLTTQLVMTLNGLCGRYDRVGGMVCKSYVLSPALPDEPQPIRVPLFSDKVARVRNVPGLCGPFGEEMPAGCLADEILKPGHGKIRALIVCGANTARALPDEAGALAALQDLDLLVVTDLFVTATARQAHYVIASTHPFERIDVANGMDWFAAAPFMQHTAPVVQPPPGVLNGFEMIWGLARRLGVTLAVPGISMERKPTGDDMLQGLNPSPRVSFDEVRQYPGGRLWDEESSRIGRILPHMIGHPDQRMALAHPEVLAELRQVRTEALIDGAGYEAGENCAFRMITYRMPEVFNTQGHDAPSLRRRVPYNPVLMHAKDMQALGLADSQRVRVDNRFGSVEGIAKSSPDIPTGVIAFAYGWGGDTTEQGSNVQRLIPDDVRHDAATGLPLMTGVPVNVAAVDRPTDCKQGRSTSL